MIRFIPMRCVNPECPAHGDVVDVQHVPERRYRGTVWAPSRGDEPACDDCGAELKYLDD